MDDLDDLARVLANRDLAAPVRRVTATPLAAPTQLEVNIRKNKPFNPLIWAIALLVLLVTVFFGWSVYDSYMQHIQREAKKMEEQNRLATFHVQLPGDISGPDAILQAVQTVPPDLIVNVNAESGDLIEKHLMYSAAGVYVTVKPDGDAGWIIKDTVDINSGKSIGMMGAVSRISVAASNAEQPAAVDRPLISPPQPKAVAPPPTSEPISAIGSPSGSNLAFKPTFPDLNHSSAIAQPSATSPQYFEVVTAQAQFDAARAAVAQKLSNNFDYQAAKLEVDTTDSRRQELKKTGEPGNAELQDATQRWMDAKNKLSAIQSDVIDNDPDMLAAQKQLRDAEAAPRTSSTHDYQQAMAWYRHAADEGDVEAMRNIGVLYEFGRGVDQDYPQAMAWYRRSADAGSMLAMCNIGFMYENGRGVEQDYRQAVGWFRKSAEAGNPVGMRAIGFMYDLGRGVDQDYQQALAWYQKAADAGDAEAMRNIGVLYEIGHGVGQDREQAIVWYRKSAGLGNEEAKNNLAQLGRE